jgi:hypothetical protein
LKRLKGRDQVRGFLAGRARNVTGRLKERLSFVMNN